MECMCQFMTEDVNNHLPVRRLLPQIRDSIEDHNPVGRICIVRGVQILVSGSHGDRTVELGIHTEILDKGTVDILAVVVDQRGGLKAFLLIDDVEMLRRGHFDIGQRSLDDGAEG